MSDVTFEPIPQGAPLNLDNTGFTVDTDADPAKDVADTPPADPAPADTTPAVDTPPAADDTPPSGETTQPSLDELLKDATEGRFANLSELMEKVDAPAAPSFKDEYIQRAVEYYEANGTLTPFLEATQYKFDDMTAEDVMRHNLRREYPGLTDEAFRHLYKREVTDKYNLDTEEYSDQEVDLGKQLMQRDANQLKAKFAEEQSQYMQPQRQEAPEQDETLKQWQESVTQNDRTKSLIADKNIEIDVDGEAFKFEVTDPQTMVDMTVDNSKFYNLFVKDNGELDLNKWYKVMAFALAPDVYEKSLVNHGKTQGVGQVENELKNPDTSKTPESPDSNLSFYDGFLQAAMNQKKKN